MLSDEELRARVERELREDVERRLRDGASRDEVVASLVEEGFVADAARTYVDAASDAGEPAHGRQRILLTALATCLVIVVTLVLLALRT